MSNVIQLPVHKLCSNCENFMCGPLGMYCGYWQEEIHLESVAEECDAFERI